MNATDVKDPNESCPKVGWWRRLVIAPLVGQLKQGSSPEELGWSVGVGATIGICPLWGTRAWICLLVGWLFKMNQPVLQVFKGLFYPLQLALMVPFIQMGQMIFGKPPLKISLQFLKEEFSKGTFMFLGRFGWVMLQAAVAWLLVFPVMMFVLKWASTPILRKAGMKFKKTKEAAV